MNAMDHRDVELATDAAVIAGQSYDQAKRIALRLVAMRLAAAARSLTESAQYADRQAYHRDREEAVKLQQRARELFDAAELIEEWVQ